MLIGLASWNEPLNICSWSEVWLAQPEQVEDKLVMKSGIWAVSKQCWIVFRNWKREQKSTHQLPDRSTSRIKRWTNTGVHHFAQDTPGIQKHFAEHDWRSFGPKSLVKQKLQIVPLTCVQTWESASQLTPRLQPVVSLLRWRWNTDGQRDVRGNTTENQTSTRKLVRNPVVERAGGAAPQPDVSQAQPMDVPLDQKATTNCCKQFWKAVLVIWGVLLDIKLSKRCCQLWRWSILRTRLPMSVTSMSITPECYGTETSALLSISVWFDGGRKVRPLTVLMCVWQRSHLKRDTLCDGNLQLWSQSTRKVRWFRRHASVESISHVDCKSSKSTSHRARTSQDYVNLGRYFCVFPTQTWMNWFMHIHQEKLSQFWKAVRLLFKAHSGARKAARLWQEYFSQWSIHEWMLHDDWHDDCGGLGWRTVSLPVVSGTGVTVGEGLFEGHRWTMGVVLLVTVGVGLLGCFCAVFDPHLPTGNVHVKREPEDVRQPRGMTLRSMRNEIINHGKERTWSLSWYSGDQLEQVMEMLNARCGRDTLVQLLRRIAIMSENQTR